MNYKNIITLPDKRLRTRSTRVGVVSDETKLIVKNMIEASLDWEHKRDHELTVALAAIQVAIPQRIIIVRIEMDKQNAKFVPFINPEIVKKDGEVIVESEGCLSVRNVYGMVPRYEKIKVKALDINGKEVRFTLTGFLARIFQHEIDHTNGVLFIDHVKDNEFYNLEKDGELRRLKDAEIEQNRLLWERAISNGG